VTPCVQRRLMSILVSCACKAGTFLDNLRQCAGAISSSFPTSDFGVTVYWVCNFTHEVLTAVCLAIPVQIAVAALRTSPGGGGGGGAPASPEESCVPSPAGAVAVAWALVGSFTALGLWGFLTVTVTKGIYADSDHGVKTAHSSADSPTSLFAVFGYSFGMIGASALLCWRHGCGCDTWAWLLAAQVACVAGQGLTEAPFAPPGYRYVQCEGLGRGLGGGSEYELLTFRRESQALPWFYFAP